MVLICIFLFGMWGQYILSPDYFRANLLQASYNTLTLFVLEGDWTANQSLPWQLEVTRFVAPLVLIAGILVTLTQGAWLRALNYFVRVRQGHVVVAGLGNRSWHFVQSCHNQYKIVIVEINPDSAYIDRARRLGMNVIIDDVLNPAVFDQVNLAGARHLVAFTGSDGLNVELAIKARAYMRQHRAEQLLVHMHVDNTHIAKGLENYPKFFADSSAAQVNFFSVYQLNARILFRDYPPEIFAHCFGQNQVHIALYNFEKQAEHILLEAIRVCHFASEIKVRFSIFDEAAEEKGERFFSTYPNPASLCEIGFIEMPILQSESLDSIATEVLQTVTEHVVCLPTDQENLELALMLRSLLLNRVGCNAPIIVNMEQSSGLAQLLESNYGGPEIPDGLYPFGMLDQVLQCENILADGLDVLARAVHESYLERHQGLEADKRLYSSLHGWLALSEPVRSSNRQQADHLATKLRAIGCSFSDTIDPDFAFSDDEAILLAKMEHHRWCSEKIAGGWQLGEERIESAKLNPIIKKWELLDSSDKQWQIDEAKGLPELVAKTGKGFVRDYRIGVTGHRLHKLDLGDARLERDIEAALAKIVKDHPRRRFVIVSPLAEGADRLVARIAMEKFNMALHVPLPLPYELYQTDFTSPDSDEVFKSMVGQAEFYFELPMRFGNQEELASHLDQSSNERRNKQYALVGAFTVQDCDELLAVWDGKPEDGLGGTGQIVGWRKQGKPDAEFLLGSDFFVKRKICQPIIIEHIFDAKQSVRSE